MLMPCRMRNARLLSKPRPARLEQLGKVDVGCHFMVSAAQARFRKGLPYGLRCSLEAQGGCRCIWYSNSDSALASNAQTSLPLLVVLLLRPLPSKVVLLLRSLPDEIWHPRTHTCEMLTQYLMSCLNFQQTSGRQDSRSSSVLGFHITLHPTLMTMQSTHIAHLQSRPSYPAHARALPCLQAISFSTSTLRGMSPVRLDLRA